MDFCRRRGESENVNNLLAMSQSRTSHSGKYLCDLAQRTNTVHLACDELFKIITLFTKTSSISERYAKFR